LEAFEEIADTVKDLNKRIIACTDTESCLIDPYLRKKYTIAGRGDTYFEEDIDTDKDCVRRWKRHLKMET
jgi:hypothetical protein